MQTIQASELNDDQILKIWHEVTGIPVSSCPSEIWLEQDDLLLFARALLSAAQNDKEAHQNALSHVAGGKPERASLPQLNGSVPTDSAVQILVQLRREIQAAVEQYEASNPNETQGIESMKSKLNALQVGINRLFAATSAPPAIPLPIAKEELYQKTCAAAYQMAGLVDAPLRFLDALNDAANGEPGLRADLETLCPVSLDEFGPDAPLPPLASESEPVVTTVGSAKCQRCGSITGDACNAAGCGYLESGNGEPANPGLIEIGHLVEIHDDMGTIFVDWNEERFKLPAGTKVYALAGPTDSDSPSAALQGETHAATEGFGQPVAQAKVGQDTVSREAMWEKRLSALNGQFERIAYGESVDHRLTAKKALELIHFWDELDAAPSLLPLVVPFGYFHELLDHEGKGNGLWLGCKDRNIVEQAHTPGETSEEIVTLYAAPCTAKSDKDLVLEKWPEAFAQQWPGGIWGRNWVVYRHEADEPNLGGYATESEAWEAAAKTLKTDSVN